MNRIKFLVVLLFMVMSITYAQQKKYVSYTVQRGESFKSLAKIYKLSKRDLMRLNPDIGKRLKSGVVIIVPNLDYGKVVIPKVQPKKTYTVLPKETIFGISRKFGVTIEALKKENPGLEDGVPIGMVLTIPKPTITIPQDSLNYVLHTIVKDDTPYNLSKRYEITEESLRRLNPILEEGFKLGMLLKIKAIDTEEDVAINDEDLFVENFDNDYKAIRVALMLPYQMQKLTDSIREGSFARGKSTLNIALDFHMGAQLAVDSLRRKGLNIDLNIFDTENSMYKLQFIENNNNFRNTDVVVGPLFYDKAEWLSKRVEAPVVSPVFSRKQGALESNNLIKSSPDKDVYEEKLMTYLESCYNGENVVVINDDKPANQSKLWRIVNRIKSIDSMQTVSVVKPETGYIDTEEFISKLDSMGHNWIVHISDDIATTSDAINNLKSPVERMHIQLFALEKGRNFESIDNSFLGKVNFIFPTSEVLIADENEALNNFYSAYVRKNHAAPSKYSYRGFDIMYDLIARIATEGSLKEGLGSGKSYRLTSLFYYDKKLFGTTENKAVHLMQFTQELDLVKMD